MQELLVNDYVKIASQPDTIFKITAVNPDKSFEIQYQLSDLQILHFGNVAAEMLLKIE